MKQSTVRLTAALLVAGANATAQTGAVAAPVTRSIDFTTDEGTWMSLDVSPDGRSIAFELLGDVYILPAAGGAARAVTHGVAFESQPRYSPDGTTLAYISDGDGSENIWLASADGTNARRLTNARRAMMVSPSFTADGRALLVTVIEAAGVGRVAELWRFDATTGVGQRILENRNGPSSLLVSSPAPGPYGAVVAPDGHSAWFTSLTPRAYGVRNGGNTRLMRLDLASGRVEPVAVEGTNPMSPQLSPDARLLAYGAQREGHAGIRIRRLQDASEYWLAWPTQDDDIEARATRDVLPRFAFTPDSRAIVAAYGGKIHRLSVDGKQDEVVPFSARVQMEVPAPVTTAARITDDPVRPRFVQHVSLAADGRMAFSALARVYVTGAGASVATARATAAAPRRLTATRHPREFSPVFSPDGKWIAFTTWESSGGGVWKAKADGSAPPVRLVADSAFYTDPAWSPDGARLAVVRAPESSARLRQGAWVSDADLSVVPAAGGRPLRVAAVGSLRHPQWSRDGSRVTLFAPGAGVVSFKADGSARQVVATLPAGVSSPFGADAGMVSPDGTTIAMILGDRLIRFPLAAAGAAPAVLDPRSPSAEILSVDAPESFTWGADGTTLGWTTGTELHRRGAATGVASDSTDLGVEVPRVKPNGTIVLRGVRAITMRGDEVIPAADIIIRDNRIVAVGARGSAPIPAGARVMELPGRTVVPGFVDVHAHLGTPQGLVEPDNTAPLSNLAWGVTTVRDPQTAPDVFTIAELADAGEMPSPRIFSTGPGLFSDTTLRSLDNARARLRRYRERYRTNYLKSYLAGTREQRRWIAQAATEAGMIATTEGGADGKEDVTHILDGYSGNEHALPMATLYRDVVQLMVASGIAYTPTLLVAFGGPLPIYRVLAEQNPAADEKLRRFFPREQLFQKSATRGLYFRPEDYRDAEQARSAAAVLRAGGLIALGGHGEMHGASAHWEMQLLAAGMRPHEILRVATRNGAEALGLLSDIGTIEVGKLADLVVLDRDPLVDIRNTTSVAYVMKNGFLYTGETLEEVWPNRVPLIAPWWWRDAGNASTTFSPRVDEYDIDAAVRREMERMRVPGVAVAVVKGDRVLMAKGYGLANIEQQVAVSAETMFESGSMAKQFTAAGVMALVEDGKLQLDASIRTYLPDAPEPWSAVTIRHMLSHTSGIPDYTGDQLDYRRDFSEDDLKRLAFSLTLEFPAGARWNYSNTNYVLLGIIIHQASGKPYGEFLRERIFTPAGMPTIRVISESAIVPHRASGYLVTNGQWQNQDWVSPTLNTTADGSMLLSLRDMIAWNATVRGRRVLKPESWAQIMTPVTLKSGKPYPYGFAMFVDTLRGAVVHQHGGAWQGFRTQYSRYEGEDLAVVVLANSRSASPDVIAGAVAGAVSTALRAEALPAAPIIDREPAVTAYVREILDKTAKGTLAASDFAFVRQTTLPRMRAFLVNVMQGTGALDRLELLSRREVGDDRSYVYRAVYGNRSFRVMPRVAPDGRLTGLMIEPEGS